MRIILFALCLCACFFAIRVLEVLTTSKLLKPLSALPHIPAPRLTLDEMIRAASRKHQVEGALIRSVIAAESAFSPDAISPKGAVGLMQLMPDTVVNSGRTRVCRTERGFRRILFELASAALFQKTFFLGGHI
jgi:hypothetical protein